MTDLLTPVLQELRYGATDGYYIYHAGLKKHIRVKLKLCFVLADMMERNELMNVDAPGGAYYGCAKCTRRSTLYYLTEDEVATHVDVGHERTMEELLKMIETMSSDDDSAKRLGYQVETPPVWLELSDFNIYSAMQTDLLHAELYGSGNFIKHFKQLLKNMGPIALTMLGRRVKQATGLQLRFRKQWHSQHWDLIARNSLFLFAGLISQTAYDVLQSHVIYLQLLRCYAIDDATVNLIDHFYTLYTRQFRTTYVDNAINYPNQHTLVHLIKEVADHKIPPSLIWTQRFEKRHSLFKALNARKRGMNWSFREYARLLQLYAVLDSIDNEKVYYSEYNGKTIRFQLHLEKHQVLTLQGGYKCISVNTLHLTSCRVRYFNM